jgi:hypothetical protein
MRIGVAQFGIGEILDDGAVSGALSTVKTMPKVGPALL